MVYAHHILYRDVLCDRDHKRKPRIDCLQRPAHHMHGWDENDGSIRACRFCRFAHRIEYRDAEYVLPAFARRDAGDDIRAVFQHLLRMERSFPSGNSLYDQTCVLINQYAHFCPPPSFFFCAERSATPSRRLSA